MTFSILLFSGIIHVFAIVMGVLCIKKGEGYFTKYCMFDLLNSSVERTYWVICFGTLSNVLLFSLAPIYYMTDNTPYTFWLFSILIGVATTAFYWAIFEDITAGRFDVKDK